MDLSRFSQTVLDLVTQNVGDFSGCGEGRQEGLKTATEAAWVKS